MATFSICKMRVEVHLNRRGHREVIATFLHDGGRTCFIHVVREDEMASFLEFLAGVFSITVRGIPGGIPGDFTIANDERAPAKKK